MQSDRRRDDGGGSCGWYAMKQLRTLAANEGHNQVELMCRRHNGRGDDAGEHSDERVSEESKSHRTELPRRVVPVRRPRSEPRERPNRAEGQIER